jgi:tRNA pseudouridine55 synthase
MCTGKMTKSIESIQSQEKEYTGTFFLGETTPSFDLETVTGQVYPIEHITPKLIEETVLTFLGETDQTPPLFSAIKVEGKRAYEIARKGGDAVLKSRKIVIKEFEITRLELPEIDFRIVCSKGTYIRSIARDFGLKLNSGAYLKALRRTKIGDYLVENAMHPQDVTTESVD